MRSSDDTTHLRDILESIELIDAFIEGVDFESYELDLKTKSAVERQMQIITEAAYRLGDNAETICPGPNWKGYRGFGNLLRHAYHRIDDRTVWETVKVDLPELREAIFKVLPD